MGIKITELMVRKEIDIDSLSGKVIAVDSSLFLYQFLSTIRQADGSLLMDSRGNITSHLSGLFFRTINLMQKGLKLVFVFDGKAPELKREERERRSQLKEEALKQYMIAKERQDLESMKKYASRTSVLTKDMINESKELLSALGLPYVQAPAEGEAQAAHMVKKNDCYAIATQDADGLMFGTPRLIRNLSMVGRRKTANKLSYATISPEIVDLKETLDSLGINHEQFVILCMLVGTDFNIEGIKGIGPKNALKLVKEFKDDFDTLFKKVEWDKHFSNNWKDIYNIIKNMPVTDSYKLEWKSYDEDKIKEILVKKHEFSAERIESALEKLEKNKIKGQKGLGDFF